MHECTHHPRKQIRKKGKDKDVPMTHHRFGCLVSAPDKTADYTVDNDVVHPSFYYFAHEIGLSLLWRGSAPNAGQ
jgi:hypothetical protein